MSEFPTIRRGVYRHAKSGKLYEVVGMALHTETYEPLVVYRPLYDVSNYEFFARPRDMFHELVGIGGIMRARFELVEE